MNVYKMNTVSFYQKRVPDPGEYVAIKITEITEVGVNASLLEYGNIQGMILLSEVSRKRIVSIHKYFTVGKIDYAEVIRVDPIRNYIDLSKKLITEEDIEKCRQKYAHACIINSIVHAVSLKSSLDMHTLYQNYIWPLFIDNESKDPYTIFKREHKYPLINEGPQLDPYIIELFNKEIRKKFNVSTITVYAEIEVTCFGYEGIEAIKTTLIAGKNSSSKKISINLIYSPRYLIKCDTLETDLEETKEEIMSVIRTIKKSITERGGSLKVAKLPDTKEIKIPDHDPEDSEDPNGSGSGSDSDLEKPNRYSGTLGYMDLDFVEDNYETSVDQLTLDDLCPVGNVSKEELQKDLDYLNSLSEPTELISISYNDPNSLKT
jgi:translation initiation factor 2 subunit 1